MRTKPPRFSTPPPKKSEENSLRLELLCGSTDVGPDHPGHWDGMGEEEDSDLLHPKHLEIHSLLHEEDGITVNVSSHREEDADYSDAYIYCRPKHLVKIAAALKKIQFEGDVLDILSPLSPKDTKLVKKMAAANGWKIQGEKNLKK